MAGRVLKRRFIDAAKALEMLVEGMGPNPTSPLFASGRCEPTDDWWRGPTPIFSPKHPCKPLARPGGFIREGTSPVFAEKPLCRPFSVIRDLQMAFLETASLCRYLAEEHGAKAIKPARRRPKAKARPRRPKRRARR